GLFGTHFDYDVRRFAFYAERSHCWQTARENSSLWLSDWPEIWLSSSWLTASVRMRSRKDVSSDTIAARLPPRVVLRIQPSTTLTAKPRLRRRKIADGSISAHTRRCSHFRLPFLTLNTAFKRCTYSTSSRSR